MARLVRGAFYNIPKQMTIRPYRRLYFLHVWAEPRDDPALPPEWRCRLEDSATREQRLFSQPDALAEFLQELQADERRGWGVRETLEM